MTEILFASTDTVTVELIGISTSKWAVLQATTGATIVNTTGLVFQVS
jgi:hypothetical protein